MSAPLLRGPVPALYFHPLNLIFQIPPPPGEVIKIYIRTMQIQLDSVIMTLHQIILNSLKTQLRKIQCWQQGPFKKEADHPPRDVNPLSVSIDSLSKNHLSFWTWGMSICISIKIKQNLTIGSFSKTTY